MDKPINMSVKEYLMRVMSLRTNTPLKHIEAVIEHQFQSAHDALRKHHSVEISGFGKFLFNKKKADRILDASIKKRKTLEESLSGDLTDLTRAKTETKIRTLTQYIEILKPKVYGDTSDNRGLEEQTHTSGGVETDDTSSISGEKEDM